MTELTSRGLMMRMHDAQVPAGALGRPNSSGGSDTISSSILRPSSRCEGTGNQRCTLSGERWNAHQLL